jgi:hypothetical protein
MPAGAALTRGARSPRTVRSAMRPIDRNLPNAAFLIALALLPMVASLIGAAVDERLRLGVTVWRAACRAEGLTLRSLVVFTAELLPGAIIGALLGGLVLLALAIGSNVRARQSLAAHLGCTVAMPIGAVLCALALPLPLMFAAEALIAGAAALLVHQMHGYALARGQ